MNQYYAGYILDSVNHWFLLSNRDVAWKGLLESLCVFDAEFNFIPNENPVDDPILNVANNLLSRGIPTRPSVFIEKSISEKLHITNYKESNGSISFDFNDTVDQDFKIKIFSSFCVVDPRIQLPRSMNQKFGSDFEKKFLFEILPSLAGGDFICQLVEPQRFLSTLLSDDLPGFNDQMVDFTFDIPLFYDSSIYPGFEPKHKCLVIEVDGPQHDSLNQRVLDIIRDRAIGCDTVRITTSDSSNLAIDKKTLIQSFLDRRYIKICKNNYVNPQYLNKDGLSAMQLALSPIAVARIQKILIQLILNKRLDLDASRWNIAVYERDVPCAKLAMDDFSRLMNNLFILENKGRSLPAINLSIIGTPEFLNAALNAGNTVYSVGDLPIQSGIDVLIDISTLQRTYCTAIEQRLVQNLSPQTTVMIRSTYSVKEERVFDCAPPLMYDPLILNEGKTIIEDDIRVNVVRTFVQDLFRKSDFREGQKEIISRALSYQSTIALLPTGGGKSLTYQLSALLQPGICLVVDPIKSLMQDQHDNLLDAAIDATVFVNSTLNTKQRQVATNDLTQGKFLFAFISPERMQIEEFRESYLGRMQPVYKKHFNYCVIDEAHCLSEWGHDFRTSYLRLGRNAIKYCRSGFPGRNIPILALTGTASYDVLADVQREVKIDDEIAIITPKEYRRPELHFKLIDASKVEIGDPAVAKRIKLTSTFEELPKFFSKESSLEEFFLPKATLTNSGIVFCPHRKDKYGVIDNLAFLTQKFPSLREYTGYYYGSENNKEDVILTDIQRKFKKDRLSLLVATKAFGMGIDKPNIRYTIHLNMPPSIESFYQEAGRAGRDKNDSFCYIIHHKEVDKKVNMSFFNNSFKGQEREIGYVFELLNEITFPYSDNVRRIQELAVDDLGVVVKINRWQTNGFDRLYINSDEVYNEGNKKQSKSYGYIDVSNLNAFVETNERKSAASYSRNKEILDHILQLSVQLRNHTNISFQQWLNQLFATPANPGIEHILNTTDQEFTEIEIGFENDKINQLTDYLKNDIDVGFSEYIIRKALEYCESENQFKNNLSRRFHNETGQWLPDDKLKHLMSDSFIEDIFSKIRLEQDTFKAIYRLSLIGVVSDYTVDYRTRMIKAHIHKSNADNYIDHLKKYIALYEPQSTVNKMKSDIYKESNLSGKSILRQTIKYLIRFIYDRIAKKRKQAIDEMESAINAGLGVLGNEAFEEAVYLYFDSKITPDLRKDLESLKNYTLDLVWKYIEKTEGKSDELGHLRGACSRLLNERPDNPILLLLRAFANYSTPEYDKKEAQKEFRRGWEVFTTKYAMSYPEYEKGINHFVELTVSYNPFTKQYLDPELTAVKINYLKSNPGKLDMVFEILNTSVLNDLYPLIDLTKSDSNKALNLLGGILYLHRSDINKAEAYLNKSIDADFVKSGLIELLLNYASSQTDEFKDILAEVILKSHPSMLYRLNEQLQDNYTQCILLSDVLQSLNKINSKLYEQFSQTE